MIAIVDVFIGDSFTLILYCDIFLIEEISVIMNSYYNVSMFSQLLRPIKIRSQNPSKLSI